MQWCPRRVPDQTTRRPTLRLNGPLMPPFLSTVQLEESPLRGDVDEFVAFFKLLRDGLLELPVKLCHEIVLRVLTRTPDKYVIHTSPGPLRVTQEIYCRRL